MIQKWEVIRGGLPVVSTLGESLRNTGRAYGGRAVWTFCRNASQSKVPSESAMAAMPAFPSTPEQERIKEL